MCDKCQKVFHSRGGFSRHRRVHIDRELTIALQDDIIIENYHVAEGGELIIADSNGDMID